MCITIVEFQNVSFRYRKEEPWVLKNCSFTIQAGEWVSIIGHNGSGKSTIAKLMSGLIFPQKGKIIINGIEVNEENVWEVRKEIGMVFQNPDNQFVGTTVQDDVAFGMENRGFKRSLMLQRIKEVLAMVNMSDYLLTEPHRLSGGQKQRVAIASVLAIKPQILILDEATAMLDPMGRREIMETVAQIQAKDNLSLITITHDLNEVIHANRMIVMNQGEVWQETTPRKLFAEQDALKEIGLDVPFIGQLTKALNQIGIPFHPTPLNQEELIDQLWAYATKKQKHLP